MKTNTFGIGQVGRRGRRFSLALLLVGMTAAGTMAWAIPTLSPDGGPPSPTGTLTAVGTFTDPNDLALGAVATYNEAVYVTAGGDLDFYFEISPASDYPGGTPVDLAQFSGVQTSGADITGLGYYNGTIDGITSGGVAPTTVDLDGNDVQFNFSSPPGIANGTTSDWLVIDTNDTTIGPNTIGLDDDSPLSGVPHGIGPGPNPVPEATTLLFGLAIVCVVGVSFIPKKGLNSLWSTGDTLAV